MRGFGGVGLFFRLLQGLRGGVLDFLENKVGVEQRDVILFIVRYILLEVLVIFYLNNLFFKKEGRKEGKQEGIERNIVLDDL